MDLALFETGDGGDFQQNGNDLQLYYGIENDPYMGMFGGNKEASTDNTVVDAQSFDWWGNNLLMRGNKSIQMNSEFERALDKIALNSAGRVRLVDTIKKDLDFMSSYATVIVTGVIPSTDRFDVEILIKQKNGSNQIVIINYRKTDDGDFFFLDFNNDFKV